MNLAKIEHARKAKSLWKSDAPTMVWPRVVMQSLK